MATPHIAGAMALLWCARPELRHNISASRTVLNEAAFFLAYKQCGTPGPPNNVVGWGRVDIAAAVGTPSPTPTANSQQRDSDANSYSHRHSKIYSGTPRPSPEHQCRARVPSGSAAEANSFANALRTTRSTLVDRLLLKTMTEQFAEGAS